MTEFEKIIEAIKPFGYPYAPDIYKGPSDHYFVYNYADERGGIFSDDAPETVIASVQVHYYLPKDENFIKTKNRIRRALFRQGFTWPEVTSIIEDKKRHLTFECDIEEEELEDGIHRT